MKLNFHYQVEYNILEYLRITNSYRLKEINNLYRLIAQTNRRFIELNDKYTHLHEKYDEMSTEFKKNKEEIINLNMKLIELENFNDYVFNLINSLSVLSSLKSFIKSIS
jgi:predicted  nucleic acid-binding Zn-ribbon protein